MAGKTILISGGTTGIGAATALLFLEQGWQVAAFSNISEHNLEFAATAKSRGLADRLLAVTADITKERELKKMVSAAKKKFRTIDVLFNNAGLGYFIEADEVDIKRFQAMIEVNVVGMADLTKLVIPIMKRQRQGLIINNASVAALVGHAASEFYAASKSAVMRYSEGLRQELASRGIKVSVIYTSTVQTQFWNKKELARRKKINWHGRQPVFLQPLDVARAVEFIASQPPQSTVTDITLLPFGNEGAYGRTTYS